MNLYIKEYSKGFVAPPHLHENEKISGFQLPDRCILPESRPSRALYVRGIEMFLKSGISKALLGLLLAGALPAQQAGSVNGVLTDPSGAAVPGARVTLAATATSISRSVSTGQDGLYNFSEVNSGEYSITAEATGFKKAVSNVRVEVNQTAGFEA
jgi:hypothetical protein